MNLVMNLVKEEEIESDERVGRGSDNRRVYQLRRLTGN
jgi:hypothetical protein